jgi:hypothetical protein
MVFAELSLLALFITSISYIIYQVFAIMNNLERYKARVRVLSTSLQMAEYATNTPFYTSLANTQTPIEMPEWLYESIHNKLKNTVLGKPNIESNVNTVGSTKID